MNSKLYAGTVRHRRTGQRPYVFKYGVFYCYIDLDEINEVDRRIRLFSYNRLNVMSFLDRDHFGDGRAGIRDAVRLHLASIGVDVRAGSVALLTNTRILNYVFNPVSWYFVRDERAALRHVIAEVHNTHGERHVYDLVREQGCACDVDTYASAVDKEFYVSPFIEMDARYKFRVKEHDGSFYIAIDEFRGEELFFQAELRVSPRRLTNSNVVKMLARYPFVTLKTIGLIHWHGLKLWLRGEPYRKHTPQEEARR